MAANKKDICVIGIGKFGTAVVEQLIELKRNVFAIDMTEERLIKVSRITTTAIADASDIDALRELGIPQYNIVIVAAENNVEIVAALIELGVKYIIAKAKTIRQERVLRQIGVDVVINPDAEAGTRTALIATNKNFIKYSESLQEVGDGYAIGSTIVNNIRWVDKPLSELKFSDFEISVVSVKRGAKVYLPTGTLKIETGDLVTVIGKISNVTIIFGELNNENSTRQLRITKIIKAAEITPGTLRRNSRLLEGAEIEEETTTKRRGFLNLVGRKKLEENEPVEKVEEKTKQIKTEKPEEKKSKPPHDAV